MLLLKTSLALYGGSRVYWVIVVLHICDVRLVGGPSPLPLHKGGEKDVLGIEIDYYNDVT